MVLQLFIKIHRILNFQSKTLVVYPIIFYDIKLVIVPDYSSYRKRSKSIVCPDFRKVYSHCLANSSDQRKALFPL